MLVAWCEGPAGYMSFSVVLSGDPRGRADRLRCIQHPFVTIILLLHGFSPSSIQHRLLSYLSSCLRSFELILNLKMRFQRVSFFFFPESCHFEYSAFQSRSGPLLLQVSNIYCLSSWIPSGHWRGDSGLQRKVVWGRASTTLSQRSALRLTLPAGKVPSSFTRLLA